MIAPIMRVNDLIEELELFKKENGNLIVLSNQLKLEDLFEIEEVRVGEDYKYGKVAVLW